MLVIFIWKIMYIHMKNKKLIRLTEVITYNLTSTVFMNKYAAISD